MEARIGRVVLIAGALSMAWIAAGPSPGAMTARITDLVTGRGVSMFGYELHVSVHVTRPDEARHRDTSSMACLVDTGHGTLLVFGPSLFNGPDRATEATIREEVDW